MLLIKIFDIIVEKQNIQKHINFIKLKKYIMLLLIY